MYQRSMIQVMFRNMIGCVTSIISDIYVCRYMEHAIKKIKSSPLVPAKKMRLQVNSIFWAMEQILKALVFIPTEKKQKDTSAINI